MNTSQRANCIKLRVLTKFAKTVGKRRSKLPYFFRLAFLRAYKFNVSDFCLKNIVVIKIFLTDMTKCQVSETLVILHVDPAHPFSLIMLEKAKEKLIRKLNRGQDANSHWS